MLINNENGIYTIKPNVDSITEVEFKKISDFIKTKRPQKLILNLDGVTTCINKFFQMLKNTNSEFFLINTESSLLSLIYMMKYDKYVKIYLDESTQKEDKYELINRDFIVLNSCT